MAADRPILEIRIVLCTGTQDDLGQIENGQEGTETGPMIADLSSYLSASEAGEVEKYWTERKVDNSKNEGALRQEPKSLSLEPRKARLGKSGWSLVNWVMRLSLLTCAVAAVANSGLGLVIFPIIVLAVLAYVLNAMITGGMKR